MSSFPTQPDKEFKEYVYDQLARIGKVLSSPQRLIIMNILSQSEHTVEELAKYANQSIANVSRHLQVLKSVNLVKVRRDGKHMQYSLTNKNTIEFYLRFKVLAWEHLAELRTAVQEISRSPTRADQIDRAELLKKIEDGDAILLDVRPGREYGESHLPGSVSIPLEELETRLEELDSDKTIVAYCRGQFCILADRAVEILRSQGYEAKRTDENIMDWMVNGIPLNSDKDTDNEEK